MNSTLDIHSVLSCTQCKVVCIDGDNRKEFDSGKDAKDFYGEYYVVDSITAEDNSLVLKLHDKEPEFRAKKEEFEKEYKEKNGKDISFFDC